MFAGVNDAARNHAVGDDLGFVIDVSEEKIQGRDPLGESALDFFPFGSGNNPRQKVVRKDALGAFVAPIDGEGDSLVEERLIGLVFAAPQLVGPQVQEQVVKGAVLFSRMVEGAEHLVVSAVEKVVAKAFCPAGTRRTGFYNHGWRPIPARIAHHMAVRDREKRCASLKKPRRPRRDKSYPRDRATSMRCAGFSLPEGWNSMSGNCSTALRRDCSQLEWMRFRSLSPAETRR